MSIWETASAFAAILRNELLLFAGVGILLGGIEDVMVDIVHGARSLWRSIFIYSRFERMTATSLPRGAVPGTLAVFIPAWDEGAVIGAMLRSCLLRWAGEDVHLFVGAYPNDPASIRAVDAVMADGGPITLCINPLPGPTTKADCLNILWGALLRWEAERGVPAKAIVLHDAEDVVHRDAPKVLSAMTERFALVQLPVLPLPSSRSRWISGHYLDEFAESHAKSLRVREALGAALPSAGVGCAIGREMLGALSAQRHGRPFDAESLTEDYELGLRIGALGGRGVLVRLRDSDGGLVATREYFPDTLDAAVRQKARWTLGIALAGWDRIGWSGTLIERWARLHDRRAPLAALILLVGYVGAIFAALCQIMAWAGLPDAHPPSEGLQALLTADLMLLLWRVAMRMLFVYRAYGWVEALRSGPRTIVGNVIAILAARRALNLYLRLWRGEAPRWDKTAHRFPGFAHARPEGQAE